jgi:hypothetical protein
LVATLTCCPQLCFLAGMLVKYDTTNTRFSLFEIAPVAVPCALSGFLYIAIFSRWLLPDDHGQSRECLPPCCCARGVLYFLREVRALATFADVLDR